MRHQKYLPVCACQQEAGLSLFLAGVLPQSPAPSLPAPASPSSTSLLNPYTMCPTACSITVFQFQLPVIRSWT